MTTNRPDAMAREADGSDRQSMGDKVKVLSKVQVMAERHGWSMARAQGFVDGETARRRGAAPSTYARVGIDEYSLGFRAGFYERGSSRPQAVASLARQLKESSAGARDG